MELTPATRFYLHGGKEVLLLGEVTTMTTPAKSRGSYEDKAYFWVGQNQQGRQVTIAVSAVASIEQGVESDFMP